MDFKDILKTLTNSLGVYLTNKTGSPTKVIANYSVISNQQFKAYKVAEITIYKIANRKKSILFNTKVQDKITTDNERDKALLKALELLYADIFLYMNSLNTKTE